VRPRGTTQDLPPATGGWREGDPVGSRQFADVGELTLEDGTSLPVRVAYETWGEYDGSNAILVLHALTGDSHVHGPAGPGHPTAGWWDSIVGPGLPIDTDRFHVVAANILGGCQGTTGPLSPAPDGQPYGRRFPDVTVRDQVAAEVALADHLGIDVWHTVVGGSAGGMRALEWAVTHPERVERLFLLASCAQASAEQIAWSTVQQAAIVHGGPLGGLDVARRMAHIAYRSEAELAERFGRSEQADGRFAVSSYLEHHGNKLVARFDPESYLVLTRAMDSHDIGRDRGGVAAALARVTAKTIVAGIDSDRLYPLYQQQELADLIAACEGLDVVESLFGHDGFLVEFEQVGALARKLLDL